MDSSIKLYWIQALTGWVPPQPVSTSPHSDSIHPASPLQLRQ